MGVAGRHGEPGARKRAVKLAPQPTQHRTRHGHASARRLSPHATRVLLLGSGELGKEVAIELQRFGVEVIAADRYADAPAMQVAHRSHVTRHARWRRDRARSIEAERPHLIVPEIEAIHTADAGGAGSEAETAWRRASSRPRAPRG